MASAKLDLVRKIYAAWARGDFSSVDWADPAIEYSLIGGPDPGHWHGVAGMTAGFLDFLSSWENWRVEAEDSYELDDDRVLVLFEFSGRGKASGLDLGQISTKGASLFQVRDGKVVSLTQYLDRERALADLGLDPDPAPILHPNVAVVRDLFEEFGRRGSELAFRVFDEEVTWDARGTPFVESLGVFHGHEGVRSFWRTWLAAWASIEFVDGPHHRANGNQVVSWWRQRNLGRGSGLPLEQEAGLVWTFQNDRIVRGALFWSWEETFRAAGLEPPKAEG